VYLEVKKRLRGADKIFEVQVVHCQPGFVLVRFVSDRALKVDGAVIASGCVTLGYFWADRPYNVYRLADPHGALIAHRFDILRDVEIDEARVVWTDLLVDAWAWPDGRVEWRDEEQLADYRARGWMSPDDEAHVHAAKAALAESLPAVIAEVEALAVRPEP
jgi:predicted RNA-binding protein associated with RNAse of E/G family